MKVMAFNARPDERAFFDHFGQSLNMDLELQPGTLTVDNAGLTRGFDGISCTCDLPAPFWKSSQKTVYAAPRCAPSVTTT